jgi:phage terminase large subunit-like protein
MVALTSMTIGPLWNASYLRTLPPTTAQRWLADLTQDEATWLEYHWPFWARPEQLPPPGDWATWLILAGRGFGKTRTGAEWVRAEVESGRRARLALVAETAADARDVMVEGESGLLAVSPPWFRPRYEPSKRRVTWPNGAIATTYSAEDPDQLRGPQHDGAWCDEPGKWKYPVDTWDNLQFGLRLGANPQTVATTTPRRTPLIRALLADATVHITRGTTYDNRPNLPAKFFRSIIRKYEGTTLGRQELHAEVLEDVPGALWTRAALEQHRVAQAPALQRIVVGVDPAITSTEDSDETGIIVAGVGDDEQGYVLSDKSLRDTPQKWAEAVRGAYHLWRADRVIAEANQGGEMVRHTLRTVDAGLPVTLVHATRGKYTRAEPISALYEQGRVHHVGTLAVLEDQLCTWVPGDADSPDSPDRLDALVWALSSLMIADEWTSA